MSGDVIIRHLPVTPPTDITKPAGVVFRRCHLAKRVIPATWGWLNRLVPTAVVRLHDLSASGTANGGAAFPDA
jgi:hypothetical protein